jgi:hypothetical protein
MPFQDYALNIERIKYAANSYPIFEQSSIEDFIKTVPEDQLRKAISSFADSSQDGRNKGGVIMVGGKKVKISFESNPQEAGSYIAKFTYVDNPNATVDLSDLIKTAISGAGTDEDQVYGVASAYRQFCQDLGKDEIAEMKKLADDYKKKYSVALYDDLWKNFSDTFERDEFDNYLMRGLFLYGDAGDVGAAKAKRIANYDTPDNAVRMLGVDKDHANSIEFLLSCPLKALRSIDGGLKMATQEDLVTYVKSTDFSSDIKSLVMSYFMGAGLAKRDTKFDHAAKVASEGREKIDPAYTVQGYSGVM